MSGKGTYEAVFGHLGMTPDEIGNRMIALQDALETLTGMAESFPSELHAKHPDVVAARELLAGAASTTHPSTTPQT